MGLVAAPSCAPPTRLVPIARDCRRETASLESCPSCLHPGALGVFWPLTSALAWSNLTSTWFSVLGSSFEVVEFEGGMVLSRL